MTLLCCDVFDRLFLLGAVKVTRYEPRKLELDRRKTLSTSSVRASIYMLDQFSFVETHTEGDATTDIEMGRVLRSRRDDASVDFKYVLFALPRASASGCFTGMLSFGFVCSASEAETAHSRANLVVSNQRSNGFKDDSDAGGCCSTRRCLCITGVVVLLIIAAAAVIYFFFRSLVAAYL